MPVYSVRKLRKDISLKVPGSKSITNRALLIAALADGTSAIRGALESDDSMHFLECLISLGFECRRGKDDIYIRGLGGNIPKKKADIYVGSAGTAARFLTSMLAFSDGEYTVTSSEQMARRPMKELIAALIGMGAEFDFLGEEYSLPFRVRGIFFGNNGNNVKEYSVSINIDKSSQYLSALLMTVPMLKKDLKIRLEGSRKAKSYVDITMRMMKEFEVAVEYNGADEYLVRKSVYEARRYDVEPDMSAACYFYAMAAVNGISAVVQGVHGDIMQGDKKFLDVLCDMGCEIEETPAGIMLTGNGTLKGIDVDMSDFSDQAMTLAAIAPFAESEVNIRNVGHIRNQECDRLMAIDTALRKMGVETAVRDDGILIRPSRPAAADIETFEDHRIAMAFAVTGTVYGNINICNPQCCEKTFPEFFNILDLITEREEKDEKDN